MGLGQVLKKIDAFPKIIDIEVNKTFSGAARESLQPILGPHHQCDLFFFY